MSRSTRLFALALCVLAAASGCAAKSAAEGAAAPPAATATVSPAELDELRKGAGLGALTEPTKVVDFELESLTGGKVKLSSFAGKVVLLNFWATWCPPCRAEIPSLEALYTKLRDRGLEIVAVDLQESKATVSSFVKANKMSFTILLDTTGSVGSEYGATAIPTTYVVNRAGFAVSGVQGSLEWGTPEMERYLLALLAEKP